MGEYVSREKVMEAYAEIYWKDERLIPFKKELDEVFDSIRDIPSADVRENVKGEWIYHKNEMSCVRWDKWECTACGERQEYKSNFCPNCGADMRATEGERDV